MRRKGGHRLAPLAILLGLGIGAFPALSTASHTPQHRFLIALKNRAEVPSQTEPLTFAGFLTLPVLPAEYGAADWEVAQAQTQWAVSLEGNIAEVIHAKDGQTYGRPPAEGDLHVHLRERPQPQCFPDGPRGEQIVTEVTPSFQPPKTGWAYDTLLKLCRDQARVRVSGWLFHDYPHVKDVGNWRASAWEIHPITKIEVWDVDQQAWQVLP